MGRFLKIWMRGYLVPFPIGPILINPAWKNGAKSESHEKPVTQKTPPQRIPAIGCEGPCSQNFKMDLRPGTIQSVIDQKIFYPDWRLRPEWKVAYMGCGSRRPWEHVFIHKKTGGTFVDVEITRYRGTCQDMSDKQRQRALAEHKKYAPYVGADGGFRW